MNNNDGIAAAAATTTTTMAGRGQIVSYMPLYSGECLAALRRALGQMDRQRSEENYHYYNASAAVATIDRYMDNSSSSSSSSSSCSEEEGKKLPIIGGEEESISESLPKSDDDLSSSNNDSDDTERPNDPPSTTATKKKKNKNKNKKNAKKQQRQTEAMLRKHLDSLMVSSFPLPEEENKEDEHLTGNNEKIMTSTLLQLEVPLAILPKDMKRNGNSVLQCRWFLELSTAMNNNNNNNNNSNNNNNNNSSAKSQSPRPPVVVVLALQSGRFAGAVYRGDACLAHKTATSYTVRKGQGKAQSNQDGGGQRRPKSIGSQLRRAGEVKLQETVAATISNWKDHFDCACLIWVSVPKTMRQQLSSATAATTTNSNTNNKNIFQWSDDRIRRIPLDVGRPTLENVHKIYSIMMTVTLRRRPATVKQEEEEECRKELKDSAAAAAITTAVAEAKNQQQEKEDNGDESDDTSTKIVPLTALHVACRNGDINSIREILEATTIESDGDGDGRDNENANGDNDARIAMINQLAGPDFMTPLHYAADACNSDNTSNNVSPSAAAECVHQLLVLRGANPCTLDARNRPPYFLAHHVKVRNAFRMARAVLGEDHCQWDAVAKVGPPLTEEDLELQKEKESEKKRKKRARQKEKKAKEKALAAKAQEEKQKHEEQQQQAEQAQRIRDGLQPKKNNNSALSCCDYCQKPCPRKNKMLNRLTYKYCSSDCVQKHKRELMAKAALARFG